MEGESDTSVRPLADLDVHVRVHECLFTTKAVTTHASGSGYFLPYPPSPPRAPPPAAPPPAAHPHAYTPARTHARTLGHFTFVRAA